MRHFLTYPMPSQFSKRGWALLTAVGAIFALLTATASSTFAQPKSTEGPSATLNELLEDETLKKVINRGATDQSRNDASEYTGPIIFGGSLEVRGGLKGVPDSADPSDPKKNKLLLQKDGGNVGIGTATPINAALEVVKAGGVQGRFAYDADRYIDIIGNVGVKLRSADSQNNPLEIVKEGKGELVFKTGLNGATAARLIILQDGNIGIGTADPKNKLTIGSSNKIQETKGLGLGADQNVVELVHSTYGNGYGSKLYGRDFGNGGTGLAIATRGNTGTWTDAVTIRADDATGGKNGNVGIGTISPNAALAIFRNGVNAAIDLGSKGENGNYWSLRHDGSDDRLAFWFKDGGDKLSLGKDGVLSGNAFSSLAKQYDWVSLGARTMTSPQLAGIPLCGASNFNNPLEPICYTGSGSNYEFKERQGVAHPNTKQKDGTIATHALTAERKIAIGLPGSQQNALLNPSLEINQPFYSRIFLGATQYQPEAQHVKMVVDARGDGRLGGANMGQIGTISGHPLSLLTNDRERLRISEYGGAEIFASENNTNALVVNGTVRIKKVGNEHGGLYVDGPAQFRNGITFPQLDANGNPTATNLAYINQAGDAMFRNLQVNGTLTDKSGNEFKPIWSGDAAKAYLASGFENASVGIGTNDPKAKLHVEGDNGLMLSRAGNQTLGGGRIGLLVGSILNVIQSAGTGNLHISGGLVPGSDDPVRTSVILQPTDGYVGIGTMQPGEILALGGSKPAIDLGAGTENRELNAGKIAYQRWSDGLDIVGAGGPNVADRKIYFYNEGGAFFNGDVQLSATKTLRSSGRMHITGEENLYLLNKGGVVVSNAWGGNGSLTVDGKTTIGNASTRGQVMLEVLGKAEIHGDVNLKLSSANNPLAKKGSYLAYDPKVQGFDIAEKFSTDSDVEPGDVLVAGKKSNTLTLSSRQYQKGAIGVVSTSPAIVFEGGEIKLAAEARFSKGKNPPVALSGRVPVKVTLENGPIHPGDYLTASSRKGYAMKATEPGPIIGIALESYTSRTSTEKIMMFVNTSEGNTELVTQELLKLRKELDEVKKKLRK